MSISYFQKDELPYWEPQVELNGSFPDFTTGWTFSVKGKLVDTNPDTLPISKSDGILGSTDGRIQVQWDTDELDLPAGTYDVQLTARDGDGNEATLGDLMFVKERIE